MEPTPNKKLAEFRSLLSEFSLDGYLIPHNDAHNSEYTALKDERIAFISGFTGSNGICLVTQKEALMWTDGRYYLQAPKELEAGWEMRKLQSGEKFWFDVVKENYPEGTKIGYDPVLISAETADKRSEMLGKNGIEFKPVDENLVDRLWTDKPGVPNDEIYIHELQFHENPTDEKLKKVAKEVAAKNCTYFLTADLNEIAYLLNLRGGDIPYNTLFFSYLLVKFDFSNPESVSWSGRVYIHKEKQSALVVNYLNQFNIAVHDYEEIYSYLKEIKEKIHVDKAETNAMLIKSVQDSANVVQGTSPVGILKAVKNAREIRGMTECHVRDGAGLVSFLAWISHEIKVNKRTDLREFDVCPKLKSFRSIQRNFKGESFDTISASGSNAAIVHYKPSEKNNDLINPDKIYLLDSGAHYLDGTTDVTRTIHFSTPSQEEKEAYTRVLLGNLDIQRLVFPKKGKINGSYIDVLARRHLWSNYKDFNHGTGHGVGYLLGVHEGPHGISFGRTTPFQVGMVVTDEPGYYQENGFGIRIEDVLTVVETGNPDYIAFKNLTLAPYDKNLIETNLLTKRDVEYINAYHQRVLQELTPLLNEQGNKLALEWLAMATAPLEL